MSLHQHTIAKHGVPVVAAIMVLGLARPLLAQTQQEFNGLRNECESRG